MRKIALLVTLVALCANAQVYKWVDEKGQTQYGEVPPPGVTATRIGVASSADAPAPAAEKPKAQEQKAADPKAGEAKAPAKDAERCRFARQQLEVLEAPAEVTFTDAKGETIPLDAATREKATQRVRDNVKQYCS